MIARSSAVLRRPSKPGFMAPFVVLEMVNAIDKVMGAENLDIALKDAQLFRLPEDNEPVREDKATRLHQAVRKLFPDFSDQIKSCFVFYHAFSGKTDICDQS